MAGPHYWIANTPSSWVAASFSTGLLPASNEEVYFDARGQGDVVGGLDQTAIDLDLLNIAEDYDGNIGADGAPLIISADVVAMRGNGTLSYKDGGGTTDVLIVDSANLQDAAIVDGATISRLRVVRGGTNVLASATVALLEMEEVQYGTTIVTMADGAAAPALYMVGGNLTTYAVGFTVLSGGYIRLLGNATGGWYQAGGYCNWASKIRGSFVPSMASAVLMRGTMDTREGIIKDFATSFNKWPSFDLIGVEGRHWQSSAIQVVE
jgi:hypothetical protein